MVRAGANRDSKKLGESFVLSAVEPFHCLSTAFQQLLSTGAGKLKVGQVVELLEIVAAGDEEAAGGSRLALGTGIGGVVQLDKHRCEGHIDTTFACISTASLL